MIDPIELSAEFRLGACGPIAVSVWQSAPRIEHAQASVALLQRLSRAHGKIGLLAILAEGCALPDEAVRATLGEGLVRVESHIAGVANVVEGQGFRAAALRGALTSLALLVGARYPQKVFGDVGAAAAFLADRAPGWPGGRELARAVDGLRRGDPP
ncbi:MAG: hypothetical protein KF729_30515 [Sandaracinaceae bacterium]|nr:hypothetical protein [Sandaracinaceae bacterium]